MLRHSADLSAAWSRRRFLQATAAGPALLALGATPQPAKERASSGLVDVNVHLFDWPTRRLPDAEPQRLVARLRANGVVQAWVGTFEALLHKDLAAANSRLADACRRFGRGILLPFGAINPTLPGWESELQRCAREHGMRGIRLYPSYHGYLLDDPRFGAVLRAAERLGLVVQLVALLEDERMMHPRWRIEAVPCEPLAGQLRQVPGVRLVLLNAWRTLPGPLLPRVLAAGNVSLDIAMLEGVGGLETQLVVIPAERVLFGSHAPFYYHDAAVLKLQESSLSPTAAQAIRSANAMRLLDARARSA